MMVPASAVWARMSLAMRNSSIPERTVRKSRVRVAGAFRVTATRLLSSTVQGSAGSGRPLMEWPQGTPLYLARNSAASLDPYFTSCLAASILWHSSAPLILPVMTSVKKSMMRRPSPVFSRTMSAIVGGFRSVVVSVVCVLADMCSSMGEGWGFVKGGDLTAEGGERRLGSRGWVRRAGHGNDGGGWLVSLRRTGEGGFQTRPYGSRDRGWVPAPYRVRGRLFAGMTEVGDFGSPQRKASSRTPARRPLVKWNLRHELRTHR